MSKETLLNNSTCIFILPFLLIGLGNAILRMKLDGGGQERVVSGVGKSMLLDFHFKAGRLYWINTHSGVLSQADLDGTNKKKVLSLGKGISGLAVDWIENKIFWSSRKRGTIQRVDSDGKNKTTVLRNLSQPSSLAIDANERFLFWLSAGVTPSIQRSDTAGRVRTTVLKVPDRLLALAVDAVDRRLFWVQQGSGKPGALGSCDYNGNLINVVTVCDPQTDDCMSVCSSLGGSGQCNCRKGFTLNKQGGYCEDINECALWNHGCSLGCENIPGSYFCTCPEGYLLLPDTKTCREIQPCVENATLCDHACTHTQEGDVCVCPVGSVLQPDGHSCKGCLSADGGGCSQVCVTLSPGRWECECQPGYQLQPDGQQCKATGPPAFLLFANGVDIRSVSMDGSGSRMLLEDPEGSLRAVDYDPVQSMVYFASPERKQIERISMDGESRELLLSTGPDSSPEGLALDWVNRKLYWTDRGSSSICRSGLDGQDREMLIFKKLLKPQGIAVHPQAQKLFWTDVGGHPAVERSRLDGLGREVLVSAGLVTPSGLALDFSSQRLYWSDLTTGVIESARMDGSDRRTLTQNQVGRPFAVAVFEDTLWVSNWGDNQLYRLNKKTGHSPEPLSVESVHPAAIVIIHPLNKPGADICLHGNGGCSQLCESRLGLAQCSCHSQHILSADGKTCLSKKTSSTGQCCKPAAFTEKMVSGTVTVISVRYSILNTSEAYIALSADQDKCFSLSCDVNAQCVLEDTGAVCRCLSGFTGDGQICVDIDECTVGFAECVSVRSECVNTAGGYFCQCRSGFSGDGHHCIDIDECRLEMHSCDINAECLNTQGHYECRCRDGFSGSGFNCHAASSVIVTIMNYSIMKLLSCPSSYDSYCLYNGVCFYFPEMDSYGCNCMPGYMGERCQFSDLEWWELQQAEQEKRRNMVITVCVALLILLLAITASTIFCYRLETLAGLEMYRCWLFPCCVCVNSDHTAGVKLFIRSAH
uniref:EGF-like domain-containing protein n=1 Tax=Pygocentrus nattereri TaxID=42514 RepID=A0AAR2J7U9_PYGNA